MTNLNASGAGSSLAGARTFNHTDAVTFDGSGSNSPTIKLIGTLQPDSVTVDTSVKNFTLTGTSATLAAGSWSNVGISEQILNDNGTMQTVRTSVAAGTSRRFLHLKVSQP